MKTHLTAVHKVLLGGLLVGLALLAAHYRKQSQDTFVPRPSVHPVNPHLVEGINSLGFRLLQVMGAGKGNLTISPLGIGTSLALVTAGAAGQTRRELATVLGVNKLSSAQLLAASRDLRANFVSDPPQAGSQIAIANSLWLGKSFPVKPSFLKTGHDYFSAGVAQVAFSSPGTMQTINDWTSKNTSGQIPQIVDALPSATVGVLVNAIYLHARWQDEFEKSHTGDGTFTSSDGKKSIVPMMQRSGTFSYFKDDKFTAVKLPYLNEMSFIAILPNPGVKLGSLTKTLNTSTWRKWQSNFAMQEGSVSLPRFEMQFGTDLVAPLQKLGVVHSFAPSKADFSAMSANRLLYLQEVRQKTRIKVDETGTEAAAATETTANAANDASSNEFSFVADHPFLAAISDDRTGAVIFLSVIDKPVN